MVWADAIGQAIAYIESHIADELSVGEIAKQVNLSPFYFQKGFSLLCGLTVMEYIRKRRLALAGSELVSSDAKVLDVALKYGYDSPDSFAKLLHGSRDDARHGAQGRRNAQILRSAKNQTIVGRWISYGLQNCTKGQFYRARRFKNIFL